MCIRDSGCGTPVVGVPVSSRLVALVLMPSVLLPEPDDVPPVPASVAESSVLSPTHAASVRANRAATAE